MNHLRALVVLVLIVPPSVLAEGLFPSEGWWQMKFSVGPHVGYERMVFRMRPFSSTSEGYSEEALKSLPADKSGLWRATLFRVYILEAPHSLPPSSIQVERMDFCMQIQQDDVSLYFGHAFTEKATLKLLRTNEETKLLFSASKNPKVFVPYMSSRDDPTISQLDREQLADLHKRILAIYE